MVEQVQLVPGDAISELDILEKAADHTTTLSTSSKEVIPPNKHRTGAWLVNDGTVAVYLALGRDAAVNSGIRLNPSGGSFELNKTNLWKGSIRAVAVSGTPVITAFEIETRYAH